MGVGHLAVAFASKRWAPRASLGWLVFAAIFADVLWSVFVLLGIERARIVPGITKAMPLDLQYAGISHSLVALLGWGALVAAVYFVLHKDARASVVVFACVFSHFVLDWISHRPDMPILPSGPRIGLGLWDHPVAAIATEAAMLLGGAWLYARGTRAPSPAQGRAFALLVLVLLAMNVGAYFGPPPPSITPMAVLNLATLVVVWLLARIDRARGLGG